MKIEIYFEFSAVTSGTYFIEVPDDASDEEVKAAVDKERSDWNESPFEVLEERVSSYCTRYDDDEITVEVYCG